MAQDRPAPAVHHRRQIEPPGVGASQPIEEGGGHREIDDHRRHRDLRRHAVAEPQPQQRRYREDGYRLDRKRDVEGKSVSVRVDLGGSRILKKKKTKTKSTTQHKQKKYK